MEHQRCLVADFRGVSDDPDFEYLIVDSTIVRAHQHAAAAKNGSEDQALGRPRGGLSTKIHLAVRGMGCPVDFHAYRRPEGRCSASRRIDRGITRRSRHRRYGLRCRSLARAIAAKGALAVIPNNPSRALKYPLDEHLLCPAPSRRILPSPSSSNSAASQPASKTPPEITGLSSPSQPSSYGYDKCPHYLRVRQ